MACAELFCYFLLMIALIHAIGEKTHALQKVAKTHATNCGYAQTARKVSNVETSLAGSGSRLSFRHLFCAVWLDNLFGLAETWL